MRRPALAVYALILLETLVWVALVPLAPTFARDLSLSKVETGAILAAGSFATLVVSFPIGVLADRVGARALTLGSAVLLAASCIGQGAAGDFWSLVVARAAFGVALGATFTAGVAWIAGDAEAVRAKALGATVTVSGLGFTIGPGFAGLVADRFGTGAPFYAAAAAAAALTLVLLGADERGGAAEHPTALRATLRRARREPLVLASIAMVTLLGVTSGGINLLVPLHLRANGVSAGDIGLAFSAGAGVFTVVSAVTARNAAAAATLTAGGASALALGLAFLVPIASGTTAAAVAFVLVRAPFWATLDTILYPIGAAGADRASLGAGAVLGLVNLSWGVAATLGPLVAGAVADVAGERATYVALAVTCAAAAAWMLRAGRTAAAGPSTVGSRAR